MYRKQGVPGGLDSLEKLFRLLDFFVILCGITLLTFPLG